MTMNRRGLLWLAALLCVVYSSSYLLAADTWIEVKSQNFTVLSNAGDRKARYVAWQFEQIRAAMRTAWPWARVTLSRPMHVIAVKDEDSMRALVPQYWERHMDDRPASVFVTAPDRHYVGMRADVEVETQGLNPHSQAYWSYCALVLGQSFLRGLPLWLSRGLSAVMSNTIVTEKAVDFGKPLPHMVAVLRDRALMTIPQLIAVQSQQWAALGADGREGFDSQSWALVQFLMFGDPKTRLNAINQRILGGASSEVAIRDAFGAVEALDDAYRLYVHQGAFKYTRLQVNSEVPADKYPVRTVSAAESAAWRASFHAAMGRPVEARALAAQARAADAALAAPYEVEGLLLDRQNERDAASEAFAKAADLNSSNYYVYYRLAVPSNAPRTPEGRTRTQQYLERAITLNDQFVPAYSSLASVMMQDAPDRAAELAVKAIQLQPDEFAHRLLLSRILVRLSRTDDAAKIARDALPLAQNDQQRQQLQQTIDLAERPAAQPQGRAAAPVGGPNRPDPSGEFGAGAYRPGGSISDPALIRKVAPKYTSEALAAKKEGVVLIEAVVLADGSVGAVRVARSLDVVTGLDQEAIAAAKQWLFQPGRDATGKAAPVIVFIELEFALRAPR